MSKQEKWYAVYTRPRWEKKVAEILTRKKIVSYCPVNKVYRQWSDRKKIVLEPLFTSYVFVQIEEAQQLQVRMTDGVINFVYWLSKPAIIRAEEIETIKKFLNEYAHVQVEKVPVNIYDTVRITSGPFMEQNGQVIEVKRKTLRVMLPSLGYVMSAEIERANVELVYVNAESKSRFNSTVKLNP